MTIISLKQTSGGIPWCMNCVGWHPDESLTIEKAIVKASNPQQDALFQHSKFQNKKALYANKSCMICGRTYKADGECDTTWDMTARRVKQELDSAGVFGVPDEKIKLIVADCRKSVNNLMAIRPKFVAMIRLGTPKDKQMALDAIDRMTFAGRLAMVITAAQEGRRQKMNVKGGSL